MALVQCGECGGKVSERAPTCPACGAPRNATRDALSVVVDDHLAAGARLESRTDRAAVLVYGRPVSHLLHLVLSLVTLGLWLVVWFFLSLGGERRHRLTMDESGAVHDESPLSGLVGRFLIAGAVVFVLWLILARSSSSRPAPAPSPVVTQPEPPRFGPAAKKRR